MSHPPNHSLPYDPRSAPSARQPIRFEEVQNDHVQHNFPERPFSYIETPIEDSTQNFDEPPAEIQPSAIAQHDVPLQHPYHTQLPAHNHALQQGYAYEKAMPPAEPHPAHYAPVMEPDHAAAKPTAPAEQPPRSYGPVAMKSEDDLRSQHTFSSLNTSSPQKKAPEKAPVTISPIATTYNPYGNTPGTRTNTIQPDSAPFSPAVMGTGARMDLNELHQPGQIPHPNMTGSSSASWTHGLCACPASDVSTCFTGLFCPCVVYGRTAHRLKQRSKRADVTDMLGYSTCNGHCILFSVGCGLQGLITALTRGRVRRLYSIEGGFGDDFAKGCCCCCCALIQSEREIKSREEKAKMNAGPGQGYSAIDNMRYEPPS